jgi:triacylglycerol lipase
MDGEEEQAQSSRSRPSLSSRLNLLLSNIPYQKPKSETHFNSEPASRQSVEVARQDSMRTTRTRPPSPRTLNTAQGFSNCAAHNRSAMSLSLNMSSGDTSQRKESHKQDESQSTFPVLRWFSTGSKQFPLQPSSSRTPTQSRSSTPMQYSDSPIDSNTLSSSHVLAIADALNDDPRLIDARSTTVDLPSRPKAARLQPPLRTWRPPTHLSDLSRSTLPTASLSPTSYVIHPHYTDPFDDALTATEHDPQLDILFSPTPTPVAIPHSPAPAHLSRSPPSLSPASTRSSIDTLRSIHERGSRGIHTTPPQQRLSLPPFRNPFAWFSNEDEAQRKENMDPFLNEEDKSTNPQSQKENLRQRCEHRCLHPSPLT